MFFLSPVASLFMDSIDDMILDSRLISQSPSVRNSVSPPKRTRVGDDLNIDWSPAPLEQGFGPLFPSSGVASHHIGELLQQTAAPQVLAQVNGHFLLMNSQFSISVSQASKLFSYLKSAVCDLSEHHQLLHRSAQESLARHQSSSASLPPIHASIS